MAVTVTPNLTTLSACDATTGWSASGGPTLILETDDHLEGTGCLSADVDVETGVFTYLTGSTSNWSGTNGVYIWIWMLSITSAYLDVQSNGGLRIRVVDTAGAVGDWYVGGSDTYSGGWRCFTAYTGYALDNDGGVNRGAITRVGCVFKATVKSKLTANAFWDYMRYGAGVTVTGGTSGAKGNFSEILTTDVAQDIGAIRNAGGVYFLQGSWTFGDTGTASTYFSDANQTLVWEGIRVGNSFHKINVVGNATGTNSFELGTISGSGTSAIASGGNYFTSASYTGITGPPFTWSFTAANTGIDIFKLGGNTFGNAGTVSLGSASAKLGNTGGSTATSLVDNVFSSPAQIVRNLETGVAALNQLRNKITFATDTAASMDLYDSYATDTSEWQIVGASASSGSGFISTLAGTQTITVSDHNFTQMDTPYVTIQAASETWNVINPTWTITDQTQLDFLGTAQGEVNEKFELNGVVQVPSGTKIVGAETYLYEALPTPALPAANQVESVSGGVAASEVLRRKYTAATPSSALTTVTHDTFAWKVYEYGYLPFVSALTIDAAIAPTATLLTDTYQDEADPAVARALGDSTNTVSIEQQTYPAVILKYTLGAGTLSVSDTVTNTNNGATGVVAEILEGDSTAGTILLNSTNATAWVDTAMTLEVPAGGATWSATYTTSTLLEYSWLIDADNLSAQQLYDYMMAKLSEDTLDTASPSYMDTVIMWGRAEHGTPLQGDGSKFMTVDNDAQNEGWAIYNLGGTGLLAISQYTADDGSAFVPQTLVSVTVTVQDKNANAIVGAQVAIFENDETVVLASTPTNASGQVSTSVTASLGGIYIRVRQSTNTASFLTTESSSNGIEAAADYIHFSSSHSFVDGEAVVYTKNGGSQVTGLTNDNTYYLNAIDADTVSVHLTASAAIAGTGAIDLSSGGAETHSFDPVRYLPNSTVGTIGATDYSVTITMTEDRTVTG